MTYSSPLMKGMAIGLTMVLGACASTLERPAEISQLTFNPDRIKADVAFIADDLLRGRETGSEGHRIAANYVAAEFTRLGIAPAGDNGTYMQEVPFRTARLNMEESTMSVTVNGQTTDLALGKDFYMSGSVKNGTGTAQGDLVFVGFGVHAPDLGHDDLAGVDLQGKIVVYLSDAPQSFHTEIRAHHGSGSTKAKVFAERGAVGRIVLNTLADEKSFSFSKLERYLGRKSYDWLDRSGASSSSPTKASAQISHEVAATLFEGAEKSLEQVLAEAAEGKSSSFPLKAQASMTRVSIQDPEFTSPNVIALLEGSDPVLKNEVVVLSAHLDHIGVSTTAKGEDKINNGAMDNATGVSVLMEVARTFQETGIRPRRSVLFAVVTGEERGLLGADYFAHYPTIDRSRLVADVNLDMPVLLYDFVDVVGFGADRSTLGPIAAEAVAKANVMLSPDPIPQEGIFTRSDHYPYVKQGIPSIFLMTGFGKTPDGKDGGKLFMEFLTKTYHSPQDEVGQGIDYNAAAKFAYINWLILNGIANNDETPRWNEGDFFGRTFAGDR
ncbi:aminopeptidase [Kordiimonas sediminis]|uniref:Aminopeptidase n=1 Tax=Kordiimonas sediminis TaxID=1735581 RepID=A0A919AX85_9PROT|nr:M28 family metallopeptidase [Kordiimonas sediminis]GHF30077.1 aminopeptidase [Kordiimonas sediminis]